ncbi:glutaminase A [Clostridium transplantifaecale]|uniref:glutaminase A n=1 Tax=Clostridium transplantifaecale TaxID=2479838 RepID=UPI0013DDD776|nr:glutaminase A [Clostridium transplantifaecale]
MQELIQDAIKLTGRYASEGSPAEYLSTLSDGDFSQFGICLTDCLGNTYAGGDSNFLFSIQSVIKVLILAAALQDSGLEKLHKAVRFEPTGDSFNSILRHEDATQRPFNPMINAGTFAAISVVAGNAETRFGKVLSLLRQMADDDSIDYDRGIYQAEYISGDRNRSLAYILRSGGIFKDSVDEILDVHFKTSSILVNCVHLSRIGAVLANDGISPLTGRLILRSEHARLIRTVMATCGLYDGSGEFAVSVGIPAKSGVSGDIMASVKNKAGIGVYSPALDPNGNSVCGMKAIQYLAEQLNLAIY